MENNFYTMKGLVYTSDGTDYIDLVRDEMGLPKENGEKMIRLDKDKAEKLKAQAKEELTALGVTFPIEIEHFVTAGNQTQLDTANVLKHMISEDLGDDFVVLNINTFVSSVIKEVSAPHLHSIIIIGWGGDYGDPQNFLVQSVYGKDNAYFTEGFSYINEVEETEATSDLIKIFKEFTKLVEEADAITDDLDARYAAYAKAEAYMLDNAIVVPVMYRQYMSLSKIDNTSKKNAMFGIQNDKMKNWRTNEKGYTTEELEKLQEEHDKGL